jgi:hypothetical protein
LKDPCLLLLNAAFLEKEQQSPPIYAETANETLRLIYKQSKAQMIQQQNNDATSTASGTLNYIIVSFDGTVSLTVHTVDRSYN